MSAGRMGHSVGHRYCVHVHSHAHTHTLSIIVGIYLSYIKYLIGKFVIMVSMTKSFDVIVTHIVRDCDIHRNAHTYNHLTASHLVSLPSYTHNEVCANCSGSHGYLHSYTHAHWPTPPVVCLELSLCRWPGCLWSYFEGLLVMCCSNSAYAPIHQSTAKGFLWSAGQVCVYNPRSIHWVICTSSGSPNMAHCTVCLCVRAGVSAWPWEEKQACLALWESVFMWWRCQHCHAPLCSMQWEDATL